MNKKGKKSLLSFLIALFLILTLDGGLSEWVGPKPKPIRGANTQAVKEHILRTGYQAGFYKKTGPAPYLLSRMDGLNYHKKIGEWVIEIHFFDDRTLDIIFLNPADPYPLFEDLTRELNQERTREAIIILKNNQELQQLIDLATAGRMLHGPIIERQAMKLKGLEEGKEDLESWEFTSGESFYVRVDSGKRPLAIGIGY